MDGTSYFRREAAIAFEMARAMTKPPDSFVCGHYMPESRASCFLGTKNKLRMLETYCRSNFFKFFRTSLVIPNHTQYCGSHCNSPLRTFDDDERIVYVIAHKTTDGSFIA